MRPSLKHMNEQAEGEAWRTKFTRPNGSFEKNEEGKIAFVPLRLPPDIARDATIMRQLTLAERKIGELKGMGAFLKNSGMLIRACLNERLE